jgi:hypothetical protein
MKIHLLALGSWTRERLSPMNWTCWLIGFDGLFPYRTHVYLQSIIVRMKDAAKPNKKPNKKEHRWRSR